jgi:putative flippase GtrA
LSQLGKSRHAEGVQSSSDQRVRVSADIASGQHDGIIARWGLVAASVLAVELAAISNYLLNDTWTFAARSRSLRRFAKFNTASLAGLALNVLSVLVLTRLGLYFLVADLIGIAAGFAANYALSVRWVWAREA